MANAYTAGELSLPQTPSLSTGLIDFVEVKFKREASDQNRRS